MQSNVFNLAILPQKQSETGCVHSAKLFHIKGNDLEYVSEITEMCR